MQFVCTLFCVFVWGCSSATKSRPIVFAVLCCFRCDKTAAGRDGVSSAEDNLFQKRAEIVCHIVHTLGRATVVSMCASLCVSMYQCYVLCCEP